VAYQLELEVTFWKTMSDIDSNHGGPLTCALVGIVLTIERIVSR